MFKPRFLTLTGLIVLAAASRLLPHPPNFAPITAIALFGGAYFARKWVAFAVPVVIMFLTDLILGLHSGMIAIYGSFVLIVCIGFLLRGRVSVGGIIGTSLLGSILFFLITNFSVWLIDGMYPHTFSGLIACYAAGIPFCQYGVLSALVYSSVLFGAFELVRRRFGVLMPVSS